MVSFATNSARLRDSPQHVNKLCMVSFDMIKEDKFNHWDIETQRETRYEMLLTQTGSQSKRLPRPID